MDAEKLKKLVRSKEVLSFLDHPNINSVGLGYKMKDGKMTDEITLQFTVDVKVGLEELESVGTVPIPESFTIDGETIQTDVIERAFDPGYEIVEESLKPFRKSRQNPLMPGISISNTSGTAGTLGCIVYGKQNGTPYMLSNWHVFQGSEGKIGDDIVQPGPYDDSNVQRNKVGQLLNSHLGLAGDCAIASIHNRGFDAQVLDIGIVPQRIAKVDLGDKVIKSGRTTSVTHGVVRRIGVTVNLNYGINVGTKKIGGFEIGLDPDFPPPDNEVSKGGDSGSVWFVKDPQTGKLTDILVGLHFAGESSSSRDEYALACNIHSVLEKLHVSLNPPQTL